MAKIRADSLNGLGNMATIRGDLAEAEQLHRESFDGYQ